MNSIEILINTPSKKEASRVARLFLQAPRIKNTNIYDPVNSDKGFSVKIEFEESDFFNDEEE